MGAIKWVVLVIVMPLAAQVVVINLCVMLQIVVVIVLVERQALQAVVQAVLNSNFYFKSIFCFEIQPHARDKL